MNDNNTCERLSRRSQRPNHKHVDGDAKPMRRTTPPAIFISRTLSGYTVLYVRNRDRLRGGQWAFRWRPALPWGWHWTLAGCWVARGGGVEGAIRTGAVKWLGQPKATRCQQEDVNFGLLYMRHFLGGFWATKTSFGDGGVGRLGGFTAKSSGRTSHSISACRPLKSGDAKLAVNFGSTGPQKQAGKQE